MVMVFFADGVEVRRSRLMIWAPSMDAGSLEPVTSDVADNCPFKGGKSKRKLNTVRKACTKYPPFTIRATDRHIPA